MSSMDCRTIFKVDRGFYIGIQPWPPLKFDRWDPCPLGVPTMLIVPRICLPVQGPFLSVEL